MELIRRGMAVLLAKLAALAAGLALIGGLARVMDPAGFGQVSLFLSLGFLISVIGARGSQMALLRFLPGARNPGAVWHVLRRRALAGTLALWAGLMALAVLVAVPGFDIAVIAAGLALGPLTGWADFTAHRLRSQGRAAVAILPKEVIWRFLALAMVAVWLLAGSGKAGAATILALLCTALLLVNAATGLILRRPAGAGAPPAGMARSFGPFWISSTANIFLAHADTAAVGLLLGPEAAGGYFIANRLAQVLGFFTAAQNQVVAPELARTHQTARLADAGRLIRLATIAQSLPTLAAGAALWLAADPVLAWIGPGLPDAGAALGWLILATCLNAVSGPADIALNMCGLERAAMRVAGFSLALSAALLPLGALVAGAEGVAAAVALATAIRKVAYWLALRRLTGLRADLLAASPGRARAA